MSLLCPHSEISRKMKNSACYKRNSKEIFPSNPTVKYKDARKPMKLRSNDLTDAEQALYDNLPGPPTSAVLKSTNVWIVEWLPPNEQRTGKLLHEWMEKHRPGWSVYKPCLRKEEVLSSIERATNLAQKARMIPVLHLEAHGNEMCLGLPDDRGGVEVLTWDELTEPLQRLNYATRGNLVLVVAACIGFAGIKALCRGPLAPAIALVGPNAPIMSDSLLSGTKEFYQRWMNGDHSFADIAACASRRSGSVSFAWEPFAILAYDALAQQLIISMRKNEQEKQADRIRERMFEETCLSSAEIEDRLSLLTQDLHTQLIQRMWDEMFMIDVYPENKERFGVNWAREIEMILRLQTD